MGDKTLEGREKEQIEFKRDLGHIKQGNPKKDKKNNKKQYIILKIFITQDKKLLKCLMIMLRTSLEIFMNQNKKEQDLKY